MEPAARCRWRGSLAGPRFAPRDLVVEKAARRRTIANCGSRLRGCGGMRAAQRHEPRRGSIGAGGRGIWLVSGARKAREHSAGVRIRREVACALDGIEPLDHLVEAHQAVADIECGNRSRGGSRCGERILRAVQRFLHCGEVDDACAPLQRMKRAKSVVEASASPGAFSSANKSSPAWSRSSRDSIRNCWRNSFMPDPAEQVRTPPAFPASTV